MSSSNPAIRVINAFEKNTCPKNIWVYPAKVVSVIIPTLNEENTIASVVGFVKQSSIVDEVIVVDDHSLDRTVEFAKEAGASVMTSTRIGKGASMLDGLLRSKGDIILYLDGDIVPYPKDTIEKMCRPLLDQVADFSKATFERDQGMVTRLAAVPLLSIYFPSLLRFSQPLSGMIAVRRSLLQKLEFDNDYGIDIGLLIDAMKQNAKIVEVNIGTIVNKKKPWNKPSMAEGVVRAILKRAFAILPTNVQSLHMSHIVRDQMDMVMRKDIAHRKKMIVFDLDHTLFRGRFIDITAKKYGFDARLATIRRERTGHVMRAKTIAKLMKGLSISDILSIVDSIDFVDDAKYVIDHLHKRDYIVGIITNGYECVAMHVQHALGVDFVLGHELEFSNGIATGEVKIPSFFMLSDNSICSDSFCKSHALMHLAHRYNIDIENIIAVGDSEVDTCMVKNAGVGVAFQPKCKELELVADLIIRKASFRPLLKIAT